MAGSGFIISLISRFVPTISWEVAGVSSRTFLLGLLSTIALPAFAYFVAVSGVLLNIYWVHGLLIGGVIASLLGVYFFRSLPRDAARTRVVMLMSTILACSIWVPLATFVACRSTQSWEETVEATWLACMAALLAIPLAYFFYHLAQRLRNRRFRLAEGWVSVWQLAGYLMMSIAIPLVIYFEINTGDLLAEGTTNTEILVELKKVGLLKLSDDRIFDLAMRDVYLWQGSLPKSIRHDQPAEEILKALRHSDDRWSGIMPFDKYELYRSAQSNYTGFSLDAKYPYYRLQISHVMENSPAYLAGVARGDYLVAIEGISARYNFERINDATDFTFEKKDGKTYRINMNKEKFQRKDVEASKILQLKGSKVGYVVFNQFSSYSWQDLKKVLADFHDKKINELVLDLRYNHGGSSYVVGLLGGAIGGSSLDTKVAIQMQGNSRYRYYRKEPYGEVVTFSSEPNTSLNLKRLFVITSSQSCSASEALIEALQPYMPVIRIGSETCGKPFGFSPFDYGDKAYFLVSFEVRNSKGQGGYTDSLSPDCRAEDDPNHPLGDVDEDGLANALTIIDSGRCKSKSYFQAEK